MAQWLHHDGAAGQRQGPVEGDGIGNVPLCISPAAADFLAAFETDERLGLIRVPINSDAYGIYRYLQVRLSMASTQGQHPHTSAFI